MRRIGFDRLRHRSRHEWDWRARDALHSFLERIQVRTGMAKWRRSDIRRVLTESVSQRCASEISQRDWAAVQRILTTQITARPARFVLDPSAACSMREAVLARWPASLQEATSRADRLLQGRCDLLGYRDIQCAPDGQVDWHADPVHGRRAPLVFYAGVPFLDPQIGDHKIIWELNRHQHWLQLGRAAWLSAETRYAQAIVAQLNGWLRANPPFIGINWASMLEIGFRAMSWTWALHFVLGCKQSVSSSPWLLDLLVGLDRQLTHLEHHLSYYFSPNTHLTGEALALYVVGTALPELAASSRWARTGRRVLLTEIDRQILADGGHAERSTHYQRYTLDFCLLALLTARSAGDREASRRFEEAAGRLADFTLAMADTRGQLPLIGDDDGGMLWPFTGRACADIRDSLALAAVVLDRPELAAWGVPEEVAWIGGSDLRQFPPRSKTQVTSRLFADTGYFTARTADGGHAVFDVGAHGYRNGGHAHADALSLALSLDGRPLLADPGTSTYTMDSQLRDRMRSSTSHNTVTLNGRSQSVPDGPFHWRSTVDARVIAHRTHDAFDWIEAAHDGYAPARHRRTVVRTRDAGWLIVDAVTGGARHSAAGHWHFDPAWHVGIDRDQGSGIRDQGSGIRDRGSGIGDRGERVRAVHPDGQTAWMLFAGGEVTLARGDASDGMGWCAPVYGQLEPTCTVRLTANSHAPFALVTWVSSGRLFKAPRLRCTPCHESDGTAVIVEISDGPRTAVFLVRSADTPHPRPLCRVGACETDAVMLHYSTDEGRLQHLVAQGTSVCPVVRINGRDLPLSSKSTTDTLLIHGSDWLAFQAESPLTPPGRDPVQVLLATPVE